jgi:hypothetical protein
MAQKEILAFEQVTLPAQDVIRELCGDGRDACAIPQLL